MYLRDMLNVVKQWVVVQPLCFCSLDLIPVSSATKSDWVLACQTLKVYTSTIVHHIKRSKEGDLGVMTESKDLW